MEKLYFRPYMPNQTVLFPQRIDEYIAENDPVRIVNTIVDSFPNRTAHEANRCPVWQYGKWICYKNARYQAQRCQGCPLRCRCFNGQSDRIIDVNHRLKEYKRRIHDVSILKEIYKKEDVTF